MKPGSRRLLLWSSKPPCEVWQGGFYINSNKTLTFLFLAEWPINGSVTLTIIRGQGRLAVEVMPAEAR